MIIFFDITLAWVIINKICFYGNQKNHKNNKLCHPLSIVTQSANIMYLVYLSVNIRKLLHHILTSRSKFIPPFLYISYTCDFCRNLYMAYIVFCYTVLIRVLYAACEKFISNIENSMPRYNHIKTHRKRY